MFELRIIDLNNKWNCAFIENIDNDYYKKYGSAMLREHLKIYPV